MTFRNFNTLKLDRNDGVGGCDGASPLKVLALELYIQMD